MKPAGLPPTPHRRFGLDLARGAAALLVCAQHLRNALLIDDKQIIDHHVWQRAFYFVTNLGHESVMVFFVLSGFLVGGSVIRGGDRFRWGDYATARLARLWCVLVPCLALTCLCDRWLLAFAPDFLNGALEGTWHSLPARGEYNDSWSTLLGNALFLQTVVVPVYGSNGPLWSLANEAWYYALFPFLLTGLRPTTSITRRVVALGATTLLCIAMPGSMLVLFGVWLLGVAVAVADRANLRVQGVHAVVAVLLFSSCLTVSRLHLIPVAWGAASDYLVGLSFAVLCLWLARVDLRQGRLLARAASHLSDMSFSLYLCHFPLVLIGAAAVYRGVRVEPGPVHLAAWFGWFALLLLAAHAMWWTFERHTAALRGWLGQLRPVAMLRRPAR
jgi:peptidoglycan/LPS O-acetylase OafA/YrhL